MKSEFSWELLGIGSFAFRDRHFASAVLYVLTPSEFKQNFFPPMNASKAAFSVHLATGLIAGNAITWSITFVDSFLVVGVDVGVAVVVVGFNVLAKDAAKVWLIRCAIFCVNYRWVGIHSDQNRFRAFRWFLFLVNKLDGCARYRITPVSHCSSAVFLTESNFQYYENGENQYRIKTMTLKTKIAIIR